MKDEDKYLSVFIGMFYLFSVMPALLIIGGFGLFYDSIEFGLVTSLFFSLFIIIISYLFKNIIRMVKER